MANEKSEGRSTIIAAVQHPIGLLALIVLVVEAVIGVLAVRAEGAAAVKIIWGMIGLLALVIVAVILTVLAGRATLGAGSGPLALSKPEPIQYDVFLSSPMAALSTPAEFENVNAEVLKLVQSLREECNLQSIFYAGQAAKSPVDFDLTEKSLEEDFRAIRRCRRFMMIYPSKVASSVLVEAGYALAAGKPSTYFVRDSHDLPFILRGAVMAEGVDVKMYEFTDHDDLRAKICKVAKEFGKD